MKKIAVVFIAMAMLICISTTASQAITIGFDPSIQDVMLGDPFNVDVNISDLGNMSPHSLGAFDIDFTYNPAVLGFNSVVFGDQLDPFGLDFFEGAIPGSGTLNIFEVSIETAADLNMFQPGSFTLASLTFDTIGVGSSPINIVSPVILGDAFGDPLTATTSNGSASVSVPEASTLMLLGSGLAGLGFYRRKRNV